MNTAVDKLLKTKWDSEDSDTTHWELFVDRLLELDSKYECDNTLKSSKQTLMDLGYSDTEIEDIVEWIEEHGGYCDCEVLINVVSRISPEKLGKWFIHPSFWTTRPRASGTDAG